ncbi:MAG: DUF885 domain-containing protein [Corynebacterium sp.]|nr:DUF885 domain-containing protein [Corynebacterium sp.]
MRNSKLDQICDQYVQDLAALCPTFATGAGIAGFDDKLQDFSPEWNEKMAELTRGVYSFAATYRPEDPIDAVTKEVVLDRLGVQLELADRGEDLASLNNIASPLQEIRDTLQLMPTETQQQRDNIRTRISLIPQALEGYRASLLEGANRGIIAAARQVVEVANQAEALANGDIFTTLAGDNEETQAARDAAAALAQWLRQDFLPKSTRANGERDGVGRDRYEALSWEFVGAKVDLDEAYEWGQDRLQEIIAEQESIAAQLYGEGTSVARAFKLLDQEEKYTIRGVDALRDWMQATADQVIADMNGVNFDIPEPVQRIEACIDPAGTGGIFYTGPSEDFSRPGRMWWSVPKGQTEFHTWQELTTVFHEGVPGHHLQIGAAMCAQEDLNAWRRLACWNSGHGEGWALYAEQLMEEFGYHEDPANRMGLLDAQRLRAARVVLDIGVHLQKDGWDYNHAAQFLADNVAMAPENRQFELMRYLGWPGQAPSYALGQRLWQDLRRDAVASGMSLKEFHARALREGSIPMGVLRFALLGGLR